MIYLDNSATTRPYPEVIEVMKRAMEEYYGNPSSLHHKGVEAEKVLNQARQITATVLKVKPGEIFFTSGGTESNNTALKGVAFQYQARGKHIVTSQVEHPCVYDTCKQLEELGFSITYLPVNQEGKITIESLSQAIRPDTILVSIMHVNNELGTIQPIDEIGEYLKKFPKVIFHVDAVQSFGKLQIRMREWGIDLLSFSAHKFHGPRGVGVLVKREGLQIQPLITGGGQEAGIRSGTENVAAIAGMAKAIRLLQERQEMDATYMYQLTSILHDGVATIPGCVINSPRTGVAPHIFNFSVPGAKAEVLLHALEEQGFYVSTKSACSSKLDEPSRVLLAAGLGIERAKSAVRVSVSADNSIEDIDQFVVALREAINRLRPYMNV